MSFKIKSGSIFEDLAFFEEAEAFSGVKKIAGKVINDFELVFGKKPNSVKSQNDFTKLMIIYGTVGKSPILDELNEKGLVDLDVIKGKNEVYLQKIITLDNSKALVVAGSDKRGTIYGLFKISEMLGVSPLVDWSSVLPKRLEEFEFEEDYYFVSKEPSVRFRGFFINDEWPAFGNWCTKNFGGFNAKAYEHVFELLLRLKGNYLWPAMWSARFHDDGPGLANCELADELGVVMGMSHHEPCLRQGEEYKYLRGKDSIYGDAWNFRTNQEGITRFWEDGLKRSGKFENVITVGMRGEADTAIMGKNATLADNIELLRDVLKTQRSLIKKYVNEDISKVPRMIALYKEVEEFFYGNENTKGLIGSEELEDVILMLCDDNFGNLRTLPTDEMRSHKGGYGMYYHFDYHGWPISFEWINSSHLPKVWEQMSMAYDFGIRDLWIVNVGDICTQEFPLSYFLDLAYDFDKWGTENINKTNEYTKLWIDKQFSHIFDKEDLENIFTILNGYTKIAGKRRMEAMNSKVYHPVNYGETKFLIEEVEALISLAKGIYDKVDEKNKPAYMALVYYPAVASLNVYRMQLYSTLNQYFASFNALIANDYAKVVSECMKFDKEIINNYHETENGKWFGMGLSEHIGFTRWNEDECQNPILMNVFPADKERIMVMVDKTTQNAQGSGWLNTKLTLDDFTDPRVDKAGFTLYAISDIDSHFSIENNIPWISLSASNGILNAEKSSERIELTIDRNKLEEESKSVPYEIIADGILVKKVSSEIKVSLPAGVVTIEVKALLTKCELEETDIFLDTKGYISIEADSFASQGDVIVNELASNGESTSDSANNNSCDLTAGFKVIEDFGKTKAGIKVFPTINYFDLNSNAPYVEYKVVVEKKGTYNAKLYLQPSNPVSVENKIVYAIGVNEKDEKEVNIIPEGARVGDHQEPWSVAVLDNIRISDITIELEEGLNSIFFYALTPAVVLEKMVIYPLDATLPESYLGPEETFKF